MTYNCIYCNKDFLQKGNYTKHTQTKKHLTNSKNAENIENIENIENTIILSTELKSPSMSIDAIVNLYRFTIEDYKYLYENGIIKTVVNIIYNKIKTDKCLFVNIENKTINIFYRGKWYINIIDDFIKECNSFDENDNYNKNIFCEIIDLFIENILLQTIRNEMVGSLKINIPIIIIEIKNGFRRKNQIKILQKLIKMMEKESITPI